MSRSLLLPGILVERNEKLLTAKYKVGQTVHCTMHVDPPEGSKGLFVIDVDEPVRINSAPSKGGKYAPYLVRGVNSHTEFYTTEMYLFEEIEENYLYDIFLSAAFRNTTLISYVVEAVRELSYRVYSPIEIQDEEGSQEDIFKRNIEAIDKSRVVVAIVEYIGADLGFELGYAKGKNKPVILFTPCRGRITCAMISGCYGAPEKTIDSLSKRLETILNR